MSLALSPRIDIVFKKLFGDPANEHLLVSLVNAVLSPEDQVESLTLLNPYTQPITLQSKISILDIKAKTQTGELLNIEIQVTDTGEYDKRSLYYWAKLYTEQLQQGESYQHLKKTIGIHILYFFAFPESPAYHNVFHLLEKDLHFPYTGDLELHTLELQKFQSAPGETSDFLSRIHTALDLWMAFLTRHDLLKPDLLPQTLPREALRQALSVLQSMEFNEAERQVYEDHMKWIRDEASAIEHAHAKGIEKGMAKGIAKGRKEGIEKGRKEGIEKGIAKGAAQERQALISKLKAAGFSEAEIQGWIETTQRQ